MNDSLALDEWTTNQQLQTDHFTLPQWHHYNQLRDILNKYPVASDHSSTGSGKTRVSLTLARSLNLKIFLISPKGLGLTWLTESRTIGFTKCLWNDECYTYSKVRGKESGLTDPGMLKRGIDKDGQLFFQPTSEWENLVSEGVLLIFDECQYASNDTQQNMAVSALSHYIVSRWIADNNCKSRVLMLSGTPFDKMKSVPGYFRALGLIKYDEFVWKTNKRYSWVRPSRSNLVQILHQTNSNDKTYIKDIKNNLSGRQKLNQSLFDLWTIHLSHHLKGEMIKPDTGYRLISNRDGEWFSLNTLTPNYRTKLKEEMQRLVDALESNDMKTSKTIWMGIDSIKATIIVKQIDRLIQDQLVSDHTRLIRPKILIYCTFLDTMKTLHQMLSKEYRCQLLSGNQSANDRQNLVRRFNLRHIDDDSIQILIVSIRLGNAGWNMQDLLGTEPRHVFIFPSFFVREMYQAEGRAYRLGMKSDVTINYVHVEENREFENKIKSKMQNSSEILRMLCNVRAASQTESYLMQNDGIQLRSSSSRAKASIRNLSSSIAPSSHPLTDVQSRSRPKKSSPFIERYRTRSKPIPASSPVSSMSRRVPLKRKFASPVSNFKVPSRRKLVSPPPFSWDYEDEDSEMDDDDFLDAQLMTLTDIDQLRIKLEFDSENENENKNEHESKSDKINQSPASNKRLSLRNISNFSMSRLDHTHQQLVQTLMHSMSDQFEAALQRVLQKPSQNSAT